MKIEFKTARFESSFLSPRTGFQPAVENIEVRFDPLTGRSVHLAHFGAIKPQPLELERYSKPEIKGFCPFCGENRLKITPKFTPDMVPEGRMSKGEALLVPNLFPYDAFSAVAIMTEEHVVGLDGLTRERLGNTISLGVSFLRRVRAASPGTPFHMMAWNYMPPSGGGLVHPHQQYFATAQPGNQYMDELKGCTEFQRKHGTSFWKELVEAEEASGERYIGNVGGSHWLGSFAPLGVLGEIICAWPYVSTVEEFGQEQADELVDGLLKMISFFKTKEIHSWNAGMFFGPDANSHFSAHIRIVPRTFINLRDFAPDFNFFQSILQEPVSVVLPEVLCAEAKTHFK